MRENTPNEKEKKYMKLVDKLNNALDGMTDEEIRELLAWWEELVSEE